MKQTMLIVGLGLIGGSLALALKGFEDFEIVGVDVSQPTLRYAAEHGVGDRVTEDAAAELPQADVVALVFPHTADTAGLMDRRRLLRMKPDAVLLNAGRGSAVDCAALAEVLSSGHLLGAWMDVTSPEPLTADHPLWDAPRALITPHTAGGYNHMEATLERIKAIFLDNLRRYVEGRTLRNQVR